MTPSTRHSPSALADFSRADMYRIEAEARRMRAEVFMAGLKWMFGGLRIRRPMGQPQAV